jgi:hypothetical protein
MLPTIDECLEIGAQGVKIPCDYYHRLEGVSGSALSYLLESNAHYENRRIFQGDSTALTFGNLVHTLVLEPENADDFVVMPKFDLRTNAGKSDKADFHQENTHKIVVDQADFKLASRMAENVRAICGPIIDSGIKELSRFVAIDGVVCKARLDIETPDGDDYDLKTYGDSSLSDFSLVKHIRTYNYDLSAAFRNIVRRYLGISTGNTYLIFVSKNSGNMVKVRQIDPDWILASEDRVFALLESRLDYLKYGLEASASILMAFNEKTK